MTRTDEEATERARQLERLLTDRLQLIANYTDQAIPDGWGFVVMVCEMGEVNGAVLHVSNVEETNVAEVVEQWLAEVKKGNFRKPTIIEIQGGNA